MESLFDAFDGFGANSGVRAGNRARFLAATHRGDSQLGGIACAQNLVRFDMARHFDALETGVFRSLESLENRFPRQGGVPNALFEVALFGGSFSRDRSKRI